MNFEALMREMPTLETSRLTLRKMSLGDADNYGRSIDNRNPKVQPPGLNMAVIISDLVLLQQSSVRSLLPHKKRHIP